jgi:pimeloyl-ACP methyl ester carboxylesterase
MHPMQKHLSTLTLHGIDLQVVRQGAGPPLLLLHGGDGPQDELPFFRRLAEHFEVIAPVHPGFAGSAVPPHFDSMDDLVYLYLDVLDALDLRQVVLMGFAMGGWAAVEIAVRTTARLAKLILVDAVGVRPGDRETRDIADIFGMAEAQLARLLYHDPTRSPDFGAVSDEDMARLAANRIAHAMYTWNPYMHNPKLRYRLHRVDVPTLLVWGESDGVVSTAYAEAYRAMLPDARLVIIPEAGHMPQVEQPERFLDAVLSFATR